MKLDAVFIRQILLTIEEETDYITSSLKLKELLDINTIELERKFMGHIFILADNEILETFPENNWPFGFVFGVDGEHSIIDVGYRMTTHGYELLDVYRNEEVFEKIKNLSIANALEISKQVMAKKILGDRRKKS